jgi:hypothetical protein
MCAWRPSFARFFRAQAGVDKLLKSAKMGQDFLSKKAPQELMMASLKIFC